MFSGKTFGVVTVPHLDAKIRESEPRLEFPWITDMLIELCEPTSVRPGGTSTAGKCE
jgi:hypothetical protein